ncbi:MAG TPA: hypothetical protein VM290_06915 [Gaiellaceae bacterium]|nr:hypothetical protein [Gaiellaceae bacterium]
MRRLLGWLGAAFGGLALLRLLRRLRSEEPREEQREAPGADVRAEELRRKLDEARTLVGEQEADEERETPVDRAEPGPAPDDRRREVHERAREAAERMKHAADGDSGA